MEMTLKQRLQKVMFLIEDKANQDWDDAQSAEAVMHYHLIGWSGGGRNAVKLLKAEFPELFGDDEDVSPPGDDPVEPLTYIDSNKVLFRDHYGRFYFWDKDGLKWHGPYTQALDACEWMCKYDELLSGGGGNNV